MEAKPITTFYLIKSNLTAKPFRTAALAIVAAVLAFVLFGGSVLSDSLKNGFVSTEARLGADIAVVPLGSEADYQGIVLSGEPGRFYFDKSIEAQIAEVEGVAVTSSQFYITSVSADCCTAAVQIIGIDPETDFVTMPWITEVYGKGLRDGELIAGSGINCGSSCELKFFGETYPVTARLGKTATGMDNTVYGSRETVKAIALSAKEAGTRLNLDIFDGDADSSVSSVLIKVEKGYDAQKVITGIRRAADGVGIVQSKSIFAGISNNLNVFTKIVGVISAVLWAVAALILAVLFSVTINGRKKEFAVLRTIGATRKKLAATVLGEALTVSVLGSAAGVILAAMIVFPFSTYIGDSLGLPYLTPKLPELLLILIVSLSLSVLAGTLAAVFSAVKISRAETYATLREGE